MSNSDRDGAFQSIGARPKYVGKSVQRLEDPRLLTGNGRYSADIRFDRMVQLAFLRSDQANALIRNIDVSAARAMPGVLDVLTGADLADIPAITAPSRMKNYHATTHHVLARERVRFVGEPVAVVVAENRYLAEDAIGCIEVEYETLPCASFAEDAASDDAPMLHPGFISNVILEREFLSGEAKAACAQALHRVSGRFRFHRKSPVAMENRCYVADYDRGRDALTLYGSTQIPGVVRDELSRLLGMPGTHVRVVAPDVGGGFGGKGSLYSEEVIVAALARRYKRPVKWVGDRLEDLASTSQGFDEIIDAELAFDDAGSLIALDADVIGDIGAYSIYPWTAALEPVQVVGFLPGPYRIPHYRGRVRGVTTPKPPTGPYRGVGRPAAVFALERLIDLAAARLGIDPAEMRRRNLVRPHEFPHRIGSGIVWDHSGFMECLDRACLDIGYSEARRQQREALSEGRWLGIGIASYAELTGIGSRISVAPGMPINTGTESATVRIDSTGAVTASFAVASHGQSLETTLAQIVAEELGVRPEHVEILQGDTAVTTHGTGTYASRSAVIGGGAAIKATRGLLEKVKRVAGRLFDVPPDRIETGDGLIFVPATNLSMTFGELARAVYADMNSLPVEAREVLETRETYDPILGTTTSATHIAVVEIDPETYQTKILRYIVAEDCGRLINPLVVDGQVQGGVAQGIGAALLEEMRYDAAGQLLTASLADYLVPTAVEIPDIAVSHIETVLPGNPGGFRGMGEGGTIGAPAAVANAISDALSHLGLSISVNELPMTPNRLFGLLQRARQQPTAE